MAVEQSPPTMNHRLEYAGLKLTTFLVGVLPREVSLRFGAMLGWIAWVVLRIRRSVVLKNLDLAFGDETSPPQRRRTALRSYMSIGRFAVEFARQRRIDESFFERFISVDSPERIEEVRNAGGLIGIGFHLGNWELLGVVQAWLGIEVSFLVGDQRNRLVDDYINRLRSSHGIRLIRRDVAMREIIRTVRAGGVVCWLSDQDAGRNGIVVDFFGYPASTPRGAAAFAVKLGRPIACMYLVREKGSHHRLIASPLFWPSTELKGDEAERELTQRYTSHLESVVRRYPEQYWWPHRRWKTTGLYSGGSAE